jgi:hypothetical protein
VKDILANITDNDIYFHGEEETLRPVLCDIGFRYGKFHVVKGLKMTNPKHVTQNSFGG